MQLRTPAGATIALTAVLLGAAPAGAHDAWLPLGDGRTATEPRPGHVFVCSTRRGAGGAHRTGGWIRGDRWNPDLKPVVDGSGTWPNARVEIALQGGERVVTANSLPTHPTGVYPIARGDDAYRYDRNPNRIRERDVLLRLPTDPEPASQPSCLPMGMTGFAVTGVAIYNALDGFGIYGVHGEDGRELTNADLDECHSHVRTVLWNGRRQEIYHYHLTREYPYTLGCYRGTPVSLTRGFPAGGATGAQGPAAGRRGGRARCRRRHAAPGGRPAAGHRPGLAHAGDRPRPPARGNAASPAALTVPAQDSP